MLDITCLICYNIINIFYMIDVKRFAALNVNYRDKCFTALNVNCDAANWETCLPFAFYMELEIIWKSWIFMM